MKKLLTAPTSIIFLLFFIILPCLYVGLIPAFIWMIFLTYLIQFIGRRLFHLLPAPKHSKLIIFNTHLFCFTFCLFALMFIIENDLEINRENHQLLSWALPVIASLQLIAACNILYVTCFLAKSISTIEHQRKMRFSDYAGTFFLLLNFPIGIWWVYPRIRKIFAYINK